MTIRAYLCVSIDTECDKGKGWRSQRPLSFAGISHGVVDVLQPLFRQYSAKPTYLLSPEVIRDSQSADALRSLRSHAELGTHLHGEYAEPNAFEPDVTSALQRDYPPAIEQEKLAYLTDLFVRAFDAQPRSFRAGRFGIGPNSLQFLEQLNYAVDSSVTPHVHWASVGTPQLDFTRAPEQPYHPNRASPDAPGTASILEVPVTIQRHRASRIPLIGQLVDKAMRPRWLRPTWSSGRELVAIAQDAIASATRMAPHAPVILNAMFHNVEVIANASPYAANENQASTIVRRLGVLLNFAQRHAIPVIGLGDVPEVLAR